MATTSTSPGIVRKILLATLVAGALDIAWAAGLTALDGKPVAGMLRIVASGPFPEARDWGFGGAVLGLVVHFGIMAVMATVFVAAYQRLELVRRNVIPAALAYGVLLWLVMYGVVLNQRFGAPFPSSDGIEVAKQLFAHVVLVGLPIGLIARR